MNFLSIEFLVLLPILAQIHRLIPKRYRAALLLGISLLAYWYWNHWTILLLLGVSLFTYLLGFAAAPADESDTRQKSGRNRSRAAVAAAVCGCIGLLVFFKYAGLGFVLPVGISFYTFQTLSYVFDVHRGALKPEQHFRDYLLYVSFFPQLVAGPIERSGHLLGQLHHPREILRSDRMYGAALILCGFVKKVVIADFIASYVDLVYADAAASNGPMTVMATVLFAIQIYCDFSGYSEIAVGAARLFGIHLMQNFRQPYLAVSFRDFWHRWHISLTGWFTDYVYKPLGGSRRGQLRTCRNILLVFLLSGIWHGAGLTFVVWGLLHGGFLIGERLLNSWQNSRIGMDQKAGKRSARIAVPIRWLLVFSLVSFAWIFFRADTIRDAGLLVKGLISGWNPDGIGTAYERIGFSAGSLFRILGSVLILPLLYRFSEWVKAQAWTTEEPEKHVAVYFAVTLSLLLLITWGWAENLASDAGAAFLYFEF